jgi:hypothetical protein
MCRLIVWRHRSNLEMAPADNGFYWMLFQNEPAAATANKDSKHDCFNGRNRMSSFWSVS